MQTVWLDQLEKKSKLSWSLVAIVALAIGGITSLVRGDSLPFPDEAQYLEISRNVLHFGIYSMDGTTPTAYRPPGYPIFLLLPLTIHDSPHAARLANSLLIIGAMFLLYRIVISTWGSRAAWCSVLLVFCYPVLFYAAGTLYPQTLALFLVVAITALVFLNPGSPLIAAAVGCLLGYLALVTPTLLFVLPLTLFAAPLLAGWRWPLSLIVLLVATGVIGAWSVRNQLSVGSPILISSNISMNLESAISKSVAETSARTNDIGQRPFDKHYLLGILDGLLCNPAAYLRKVVGFFGYRNELETASEQTALRDLAMFFSYYLLLALAASRLVRSRQPGLSRVELWIILLYVSAAFFQALAFTRIRYRLPLDFLVISMAGISLCHWLQPRAVRKD